MLWAKLTYGNVRLGGYDATGISASVGDSDPYLTIS